MSSLRFEASRETAKSTVDSLRLPMLQNLPIALPSAAEQVTIAHCLDHANRRINRLIRAKRRLIELLNEQKQAIIHRAVTRGLDPDVRLRPSGIDWLGDVPEHWESIRLKYLFREVDDRSRDGVETLLSMRMYQGLVPHSQVSTKQIPNNSLIGFKRTEPSDIVMNRMRAAIGMFAVTTTPGIVSPDYAVLRSVGDSVPEYFLELFKTLGMRSVFRIESRGLGTGSSGFLRLYMDRFGVIHVPCPSASEQTQIVAHISGATKDLFAAQERIIREISLVTEYRTRLIADVVTGKLDVRGVELPPLDDDDALDEIDASEEGDADADALDEEPNERDA